MSLRLVLVLLFAGILAGCAVPQAAFPPEVNIAVTTQAVPLQPPSSCSNAFIQKSLDHTTRTFGEAVHQFQTNGAGVAVNDLDGDGWLDIVLANLNGPSSIFWNTQNLTFSKETLPENRTRAVNIVDVNGDGMLDVVFTHISSSLSYWRNVGSQSGKRTSFVRDTLPNVFKPAHAMAWGDLNGDTALDLVTGSYDAELHIELGNTFLFSDGAGVYFYKNQGDAFIPQRLSSGSQALVIGLLDLNQDARPDIFVGNDFDIADMAWINLPERWQPTQPFANTSQHPMNMDWGDLQNNGSFSIFMTDMAPYDTSVDTLARWLPMMALMPNKLPSDDAQYPENVLLTRKGGGEFHNLAERQGISASGWSWSGKFGDLDHDGFLDLYVVNGMIDAELFDYLPNHELVEENQAFRNTGNGAFVPAPEWELGSTASGRGMMMADLDNDGDLDIVINNLRHPAQLFENSLCEGASLEAELRWPDSQNSFAVGAILVLHSSAGVMTRDVRVSSGYLSGDPVRVHFGFPADTMLSRLDVHWPDGGVSSIEKLSQHTLITITR